MAVEEFNLATSDKQDQILANFPISGGVDWSRYSAFSKELPTFTKSSSTKIFEVIGSGFVDYLSVVSTAMFMYTPWNNQNHAALKLVLDGVDIVNVELTNTSENNASSITFTFEGASNALGYLVAEPLPWVENISGASKISKTVLSRKSPLFFKRSLEVWMKTASDPGNNTGGTGAKTVFKISGGVGNVIN